MSWIIQTAPTSEPVSLLEAKAHLRITQASEDALISALITAARTHVEQVCEHALMPQVWTMLADVFDGLTLPGGNIRALTAIAYTDSGGVAQTLDLAKVVVDLSRTPAKVTRAANATWPGLLNQANVVRATYDVGYASAAAVPAPLKSAILLLVGDLFENREAQSINTVLTENATVKALLWPYRRIEI